jgi:putative addiction module component (TIGR02574 family)
MPATVASLGIDRLPRDERLALVQEIWDTIAAEPNPVQLTEAQRVELARRIAEDEAAPDDVMPWDAVKAEALAQLKRP